MEVMILDRSRSSLWDFKNDRNKRKADENWAEVPFFTPLSCLRLRSEFRISSQTRVKILQRVSSRLETSL